MILIPDDLTAEECLSLLKYLECSDHREPFLHLASAKAHEAVKQMTLEEQLLASRAAVVLRR